MKLSVVMAVYNGQEYLKESIDSILSQTYSDFEFIIVNDGSIDATKNILDALEDSRVQVYHLENNCGLSRALNFGIEHANGEWIVRQDADDISLPRRIEEQVKYLSNHPNVIGVSSLIRCLIGKIPVDELLMQNIEGTNGILTREQMMSHRFIAPPFIHGSVTFSKKVFSEVGCYDERYPICQDHDLWIRMLEVGPIDKLREVLYEYRVLPYSLSNRDEVATCKEVLQICTTNIRDWLPKKKGSNPAMVIIGPYTGCEFVKNEISPRTNLKVQKYIVEDEERVYEAYDSFLNQEVEAIIVLQGRNSKSIIHYLQNKGMELNKNLFDIWNVFY